MKNAFKNIDEYLLLFPIEVMEKLAELRKTIHAVAPDLEEYIGYQMPAFKYMGKPLVYLPDIKNILDFIRELMVLRILKRISKKENISFPKGLYSFRSQKIFRLN